MTKKFNHHSLLKTVSWLIVFGIAMAYLESAVVVYLREIYYPNGFTFPLIAIESNIAAVEFWREVATIIMLAGIGILTGKSGIQRFAFFLLVFAIWDIFYYIFLYVLLGWPSSLFTWDILFLIPVPWVGPVITPIIVSSLMIILSFILIYFEKKINIKEWLGLLSGSLLIITSWILDYWNYCTLNPSSGIWTLDSNQDLFSSTLQYIPSSFNWYIFFLGVLFITFSLVSYYLRNRKSKSYEN